MAIVFTAVPRFDPACGGNWTNFIACSGLTQPRKVISTDIPLCPTVFREFTDEDW